MSHKKIMKTSQVAMLSALGVSALIVITLVGLGWGAIPDMESGDVGERQEVDFSDRTSGNFDLKDFRSVIFDGAWDVDLVQGDNWQIELSYPADLEDEIRVEVEENRLVLDSGNWYMRDWDWWGGKDTHITARIIMPELHAVEITGTTELDFSGFEGDRLSIIISGAGHVEGNDGRYDEMTVTMSGAGHVNMRDLIVVDAEVIISGAGVVSLSMDGGVLSGDLSGFGKIEYYGTVTDERIHISGFGSVERKDEEKERAD